MAQVYAQSGLSPFGVQALPVGHVATAPAHVAAQAVVPDLKLHADLVEKFEVAEDASRTNREKAERDIDYYDGKQWTDKEVKELTKRGQPASTDNRIKRKIRYLQGLEQNQRTDPKALPVTPKHENDAHSVTDALRSVCQANRYEQIRSKTWKDILSAGWGGVEVVTEERADPAMPQEQADKSNPRIVLRRCQWDRMFWDPFSCAEDFSDARYLGLVLWMDREEAILRYGDDAGKVFDETVSIGQVGGTYDDKPKDTTWISYDKRYRIRVVQMYHVGADGTWQFCEFTKGGFLKYGSSPWLDDSGKPEHPYSWRSANVDRDNNRYGEIRDMIDPQDGVNKRKSKLLHLVSVRQTFAEETALGSMDTRQMRAELAKPDGHVPLAPGKEFGKHFGIIPTGDMTDGQTLLLQQDLASMDLQGPNAAMQGKDPREQSGRAILAQQQGGALEANPIYDTLRDMDHEVYRKIWRRVRQFWTAEEWIRITDETNNVRWVGLNAPQVDQATGQPVIDPMTGQPALQNQVAQLDVDIIVGDAPHVGSLQQEEFESLAKLAGTGFPVSPKILIKASSFRSKGEMLEDLEKAEQAQQQQGDPETAKAKAALEIEMAKAQAQIQAKQAMAQAELQFKQQERAMELQFEREKLELELEGIQRKAEISLAAQAETARRAAQVPAPLTRQ